METYLLQKVYVVKYNCNYESFTDCLSHILFLYTFIQFTVGNVSRSICSFIGTFLTVRFLHFYQSILYTPFIITFVYFRRKNLGAYFL